MTAVMDTQDGTESGQRLVPLSSVVGLMQEAMLEASYLKGSADVIVKAASSRLDSLLEQLDTAEEGEP